MIKSVIVFVMLFACCYCLESNDLVATEARAKKKKSSAKLLGMILLFVLSKVAIFKAISVFLMMSVFQKLFTLGGLLFKFFMKNKQEGPPPMYGAPQSSYDTVGYSYGAPDNEPYHQEGYPGSDLGNSIDWLLNKHT